MIPLLNSVGKKLFVLRRISSGQVINPRAVWPNADESQPIAGLDPDLEYLPIFTEIVPDYDSAHYTLSKIEGEDVPNSRWVITYSTVDRPKTEVKELAENYKRIEVDKHIPQADFTENVIRTLAAVLRQAKDLVLTAKEQELVDAVVAQAAILERNDAHLEQLKIQIDAGEKPALEEGWDAAR